MKTAFLLSTLMIIFSGCVAPVAYHLEDQSDLVAGYRKYAMDVNPVVDQGSNAFMPFRRLDLGAVKIIESGKTTYDLRLEYAGDEWLFIRPGQSLTMLINEERLTLSGEGSAESRHVSGSGTVHEMAYFPVDRKTLARIAEAATVTIRVDGADGYLERRLTEQNKQFLRLFLNDTAAE